MSRSILFIFLLLSIHATVWAQSDNDRAKAYYYEAATEYEKTNYRTCLEYCDRVEEILGTSNARVEVLRIKAYFELGEMAEAQKSMNRLSTFPADEALTSEVLPLIVRIEEAERERIRKEEEAEAKRRALIENAEFVDGLGLVKANGKVGFVDETGELVIPYQYDEAYPFEDGLARVRVGGKWGVIGRSGNEVVEPQYARLSAFDDEGLAYYTLRRSETDWPWSAGIINRSGETIGSMLTKVEQYDRDYVFRWIAHWLTEGSDKDYGMAVSLYNWVNPGSPYYAEAQLELGDLYYTADGVPRDYEKALAHYEKADQHLLTKNWELRERIGDMYATGSGTAMDVEKALHYYKQEVFSVSEVSDLSMKYLIVAADAGYFDAALAHLQQIKSHLEKDSQRFGEADKLYYAEGYIYERKGDTQEAKKLYRRARLFKERPYGIKAQERLKDL